MLKGKNGGKKKEHTHTGQPEIVWANAVPIPVAGPVLVPFPQLVEQTKYLFAEIISIIITSAMSSVRPKELLTS